MKFDEFMTFDIWYKSYMTAGAGAVENTRDLMLAAWEAGAKHGAPPVVLRDLFAGWAMQAKLTRRPWAERHHELSAICYEIAGAMLAARGGDGESKRNCCGR